MRMSFRAEYFEKRWWKWKLSEVMEIDNRISWFNIFLLHVKDEINEIDKQTKIKN